MCDMKRILSECLRLRRLNVCLFVVGLAMVSSTNAQYSITTSWTIATNTRPYVTSGVTERGIAYNPFTDHVLLVSRYQGNTFPPHIAILGGATGADLGRMDTNGVFGGTFALSMIEVADDGAIYGGNLSGSA